MSGRWVLALGVLGAWDGVAAQVVRLTLVTEGTRTPVAGAIVSLLTSDGAIARRGLTNEAGRLVLRAPRGGAHRLRADRIGFRGLTSDLINVPDTGSVSVEIEMPDAPVVLTELKVTSSSSCSGDPATSAATADLWNEIRKALDATALAKRLGLTFTMALWRRELNEGLDLKFETVDTIETAVPRPFFAAAPEALVAQGYILPNDKGSTFFGPDEEVLMSPGFLSTHCFGLNRRTANGQQQVGLRFEPIRERKLPDIGGTLWVDVATRELREVDYRYRNVPASVPRDGLMGKVEFASLPEGWWIVTRWNIRMPQVQEIQIRIVSRPQEHGTVERRQIIRGYLDDGGAIVSVKGPPRGQYAIRQ